MHFHLNFRQVVLPNSDSISITVSFKGLYGEELSRHCYLSQLNSPAPSYIMSIIISRLNHVRHNYTHIYINGIFLNKVMWFEGFLQKRKTELDDTNISSPS